MFGLKSLPYFCDTETNALNMKGKQITTTTAATTTTTTTTTTITNTTTITTTVHGIKGKKHTSGFMFIRLRKQWRILVSGSGISRLRILSLKQLNQRRDLRLGSWVSFGTSYAFDSHFFFLNVTFLCIFKDYFYCKVSSVTFLKLFFQKIFCSCIYSFCIYILCVFYILFFFFLRQGRYLYVD